MPFVDTMPSQFLAQNAATQPPPAHCARFPNSPLAAGCGRAIPLPLSTKARRRTRTPRSSRPSSRSTGRAPTKSSRLAPVPPMTARTAPLWALSSYTWIYPPTCPARMLAGAFRYNAASPVPTLTTMATCRSVASGVDPICADNFSMKSPPYHVTQDDVSTPLRRFEVKKIIRHQSVRGRGGVIAVMYETHWTGLSGPSWEREMDLQFFRHEILRYWVCTPNQHRQTNHLCRRIRIGAAQRELSRSNGERSLAPSYGCVLRAEWLSRYSTTVLPNEAHFWYKGDDGLRCLGKISASTTADAVHLVRFLDDPGPIKLRLTPARYAISTGAVRIYWCLQVHLATAFARGVQCNVDESQGAAVDS